MYKLTIENLVLEDQRYRHIDASYRELVRLILNEFSEKKEAAKTIGIPIFEYKPAIEQEI